ncbi:hypothetical protein [Erythrobacter mangrovi]|uniref:Tetratricopeptide repeat protein n=1 Tax=Erythrobacter mangrovi TaxID=2739433 RepID=A0A7D3XS85_9SPHN|nr:hypothetical protein [Erythrobacter mangrovi]QKG71611.1 hypothetical protein HQR01_09695 [Erythrobacter mangrovi]
MIFSRLTRAKGTASTMALAIAVATGAMVSSVAFEAPAFAAKKKEKVAYSKAFIAAYQPLQVLLQAEAPDAAAIKAALPPVLAAVENEDDRFATGQAYVAVSQKLNDLSLALQGLELMLASGKVPAENLGIYNFQAGQIAYKYEDYAKARTYLQAALDVGYTENTPETFIAESYFAEDRDAEGLNYLTGVIEARKAAGQPIDEAWIKRGLSIAYNAQMKAEAQKYAALYVREFPGPTSWKDAIAILLNTGGYENPEILDLLRLGRRAGTLTDGRMYMEYVDAADYRRLPGEVVSVVEEGRTKGLLPSDDPYINDTYNQAATRTKADQADMASLMRDARAPNATLRTVMAAADSLLSLGRAAEAEEFYAKASGIAGADTALVLTRLGIAQFDQGKLAEANATFGKVTGIRQPIANLWLIYADEKASGAM